MDKGNIIELADGRLSKFQRRILAELGRRSAMPHEELLDIILLDHYIRDVQGSEGFSGDWDSILTVVETAISEDEADNAPERRTGCH